MRKPDVRSNQKRAVNPHRPREGKHRRQVLNLLQVTPVTSRTSSAPDAKLVQINLRVRPAVRQRLQVAAAQRGVTLQSLVLAALRDAEFMVSLRDLVDRRKFKGSLSGPIRLRARK